MALPDLTGGWKTKVWDVVEKEPHPSDVVADAGDDRLGDKRRHERCARRHAHQDEVERINVVGE